MMPWYLDYCGYFFMLQGLKLVKLESDSNIFQEFLPASYDYVREIGLITPLIACEQGQIFHGRMSPNVKVREGRSFGAFLPPVLKKHLAC